MAGAILPRRVFTWRATIRAALEGAALGLAAGFTMWSFATAFH
jgi:hypothetical protein